MGDKKVSRSIEFSIEDAKRLERLAQNREQLFEEYVSEMIPIYLIPMLESEFLTFKTEEITVDEIHALTKRSLVENLKFETEPPLISSSIDKRLHLNGHTRKLFPFIVILRCLLVLMNQQSTQYVPYDRYRTFVFETAKKLKKHLASHPDYVGADGFYERGFLDGLPWIPYEDGLDRGYSRSTNTSIAERMRRSENWFHQYYSKANPKAKNPGLLLQLNLVHVHGTGNAAQITLTNAGRELAIGFENPLLDRTMDERTGPKFIEAPLSHDEKRLFAGFIAIEATHEAIRMKNVLRFIADNAHGEGVSRTQIQQAIEENEIQEFSRYGNRNTINKELSGLLGRLWDMGLVSDQLNLLRYSRVKRYICTSKGRFFIDSL